MPVFATFAELKAAVISYTVRTDAAFAAQLPTFAALAEDRMFIGAEAPLPSDPVRLPAMETAADVDITDGTGALPSGYLSMRRIRWDGEPKTVPDYEAPSVFYANRYTATSGSPVSYTVEGGSIHVSPMITGTLKATYYARPAALAVDGDTNTVLTAHPTLYLRAMLIEAYAFTRDFEMQAQEFAAYKAAVDGIASHARRQRMGANRLAIRIPGARI
jgi:hypothetical protein